MAVLHALAFTIGSGNYAWPECAGRGGPWHVESGRFAATPAEVTCRRCLSTNSFQSGNREGARP